jgi:hypothetical protein
VLSIPLIIYSAGKWLNQFTYYIDVAWLPFAQTASLALVLVLAAISLQSIRIALKNTGDILKSD